MAENFASWSPYNYVYNNPMIYNDPTGMAGNLAVGITIIFKKDDNISDEAFAAYTEEYINNVLKVWADKGTGGKITFKSVRGDFDEDDLGENENLVHVGDYGDDPSKVTGDNDEISFMNAKGSGGKNTPAHEFGHHMGLEDRYLEGFNWDLSGGIGARRTTPIGNDEINDLGYDPNNNLYSSGDATLTDYQIRVANGAEPPEPNYQKSRGIMYKHVGRNVEAIPYTVSNGKVSGLEQFKGSKRSTRKKLEKHIKLEKRF